MKTLGVFLGDVLTGHLGERADGRVAFRFADSYRAMVRRPVLGQRFEDDLERTYIGKQAGQLPAFFANMLPGEQLRSIIERSLGMEGSSDLDLLAAADPDLPGAVRIRTGEETLTFDGDAASGDEHNGVNREDLGLHFSLAGVQLKFSAIQANGRFTVPAHDSTGDWIVKVAIAGFSGLAENEHGVLEWARLTGFDVPECTLVPPERLGDLSRYVPPLRSGVAIRRYDRKGSDRIHQEDFNQVLGRQPWSDGGEKYDFTYEQLGFLLGRIVGPAAIDEFICRLVFVIASGNNDAHLKNWSLIYPDGIHPELSPLYDQVATVAWPDTDRRLALKLTGSREFGRINKESIRRLARRLGRDEASGLGLVQETLVRIRKAWQALDRSHLPTEHTAALREHWERVPLLREAGPLE